MRDAHTEELATIPEDMQDIYHAFVAETGDLLQAAGADILRLEATGDMDLVAALFRGMHTIKGGAGFLNLRTLAAVAHRAEDILADVRDGRRELTAELIETLLSAVREIENILGLGVEGRTNAAEYVRIQATTLDRLLELSGELVVRRNQLDSSVHRNADTETASNLETLRSLVQQMQGMVLAARMQPIASVWGELPRAVRDLAGSLGKEVTLRLEGDDTELDRGLIEPLREVLLHLVRNALDHGIEDSTVREAAGKSPAGVLRIAAQPSAGEVLITVEDDGRGINLETIRRLSVERGILTGPEAAQVSDTGLLDIIFQPGFSTRSSVSATSGRGVGMDVVRSSVEQIGGKVSITTEAGRGTSITMRLPTTLVGVPVLVVRVGELLYGLTRSCVLSILDERSWGMVAGSRVVRFNEEVLPTVNIGRAMGVPTASEGKAAIVCEVEGNRGAFVVDAAVDYTELVVKKLDPLLNPAGIYSGGGVLGDGKLVVLLDVQGFLKKHGPELRAVPATMDPVALVDAPVDTATNVLLCRGESGLMAIDTVKVERVVGLSEVESRVLRYGVMEFESSLLQVVDTLGNPLSSLEGFAALILLAASNARTKTAVAVREVIDIERLPIESVDDSIENQAGDTIISTTWGPVALLPQLNAIVGETVT